MASIAERTFIAIKPDGVQRGLVGEIIKRFEQKGFKLVAMKLIHVSFPAFVHLLLYTNCTLTPEQHAVKADVVYRTIKPNVFGIVPIPSSG